MRTTREMALPVIAIVSLVALGIIAGCGPMGTKGNGKVTMETRQTQPFTKVEIEGIFPVELSQDGGDAWVKVETDENLQDFISVKNEGDVLRIEMAKKASIRNSTQMKVYVNIKDIEQLDFNSVGTLSCNDTLQLDSVEVNTEAVGKMELSLNADFLRTHLKSVGNTILEGNVREARINNSGVGSLYTFGLKAQTLMIHNTSVGVAEVYADSAFYIRSTAVGALYYKGPGSIMEMKTTGLGKVEKKD